METTLTFLDAYCERAGQSGFWGEPVNAVTNLFFIFAAYYAFRMTRQLPDRSFRAVADVWLLIASLFAIGIGSGLWHTYATHETMLADVLPITLFINIYLIAAMRRFLDYGWGKVIALWLAYNAVGVVAQLALPPDTLNGTIMYIPTYLTLILLSFAIHRRDAVTGGIFFMVLWIWTASLVFRTIDHQVCTEFSLGTHFLWHSLNAWVLYRLLVALMDCIRNKAS